MPNRSLVVLATIAVVFVLYWGEPFFVPVLIALLLSYALHPVVSAITVVVRYRVLAAGIVMAAIVGLIGFAGWAWSDDIDGLWQKVPIAAKTISKSLQSMSQQPGNPVAEVKKAAREVEAIGNESPRTAAPPPASAASPTPVWQVMWRGWKSVMTAAAQVMAVLFLVFFMLASGDLFKRKLIALAGKRLSERKDALKVIEEIDTKIRRYLGVVLVSDILVGLGTWAAFAAFGVEYAGLWGVAAGVLHTAPYFGPAIVAAASLVAAFLQFNEWGISLMIAASSVGIATLIGMVFATWLASRTMQLNTTASFIGLLFFGWIWDLWGVLLAIPILAIVKTICDNNDDWKSIGELLGH